MCAHILAAQLRADLCGNPFWIVVECIFWDLIWQKVATFGASTSAAQTNGLQHFRKKKEVWLVLGLTTLKRVALCVWQLANQNKTSLVCKFQNLLVYSPRDSRQIGSQVWVVWVSWRKFINSIWPEAMQFIDLFNHSKNKWSFSKGKQSWKKT